MAQKVRIELSEEEHEELQRLARSETRPFRAVQRARMILYSADGATDAEIARPFDWTFTRADLGRVLVRVAERESQLTLAA